MIMFWNKLLSVNSVFDVKYKLGEVGCSVEGSGVSIACCVGV